MKRALLFLMGSFLALSASALTYNVTVPAGTKCCYIAGDMTDAWNFKEMTKVDATHYTIDIADAKTTDGYKYLSGPDWEYVEKDANGNEMGNRTYSENDVVASWAAIYDDGSEETQGLTYNVTVPFGTKVCYVIGGMTGWEFQPMDKVDNTHYTLFISTAKVSDKYKYCSGADWAYVEKGAGGEEISDRAYSENDVVASWAAIYDDGSEDPQGLTYNVTVPDGTKICYIAGDMTGWKHVAMDKVDDTHYTLSIDTATVSDGYKYCSGPGWQYEEKTAEDGPVNNRVYTENDVVARWASVYDPGVQAGSITFTVTVPEGTEACYMIGSFNDWSKENPVAMTKNADGTYTCTLDNVTDVSYKYYNGKLWELHGNRTASVATSTTVNDVVDSWDIESSVSGVQAESMKIYAAGGMLCVKAAKAAAVAVYNAQGMLVKVVNAVAGLNTINLPKGLYIANGTKVLVY